MIDAQLGSVVGATRISSGSTSAKSGSVTTRDDALDDAAADADARDRRRRRPSSARAASSVAIGSGMPAHARAAIARRSVGLAALASARARARARVGGQPRAIELARRSGRRRRRGRRAAPSAASCSPSCRAAPRATSSACRNDRLPTPRSGIRSRGQRAAAARAAGRCARGTAASSSRSQSRGRAARRACSRRAGPRCRRARRSRSTMRAQRRGVLAPDAARELALERAVEAVAAHDLVEVDLAARRAPDVLDDRHLGAAGAPLSAEMSPTPVRSTSASERVVHAAGSRPARSTVCTMTARSVAVPRLAQRRRGLRRVQRRRRARCSRATSVVVRRPSRARAAVWSRTRRGGAAATAA